MRFLAQKAQELAAERYYSVVINVQSNKRGSMWPGFAEKRCLMRSEILQDIAESADSINHGLQTVDVAAAEAAL